LANKVGLKLGDYEIVRCFENTNYFKEKYVDDEDNKNMTRSKAATEADQQEQEQEQQQQERPTSNKSDISISDEITENNLIDELVKTGKFTEEEAKEFASQNIVSGANITSASDDASANDTQASGNDEQQQELEQVDQNQTRLQIMANANQTTSSKADSSSAEGCDSSYPEICITTYSAKLICADIPFRNFKVILPDPHGFDSDADGIGCEE
jgi:polyhydroxyalkanoate synthesis regulator phasin